AGIGQSESNGAQNDHDYALFGRGGQAADQVDRNRAGLRPDENFPQ
ncbi:MAG: hypothetical protein HRU13_09120, partial [Phycisphaerales bacterium]|nr:hypothetical protein [Phycisphaerales bacterium]